MKRTLLLLLVILSSSVAAVEEQYPFDNPQQQQLFNELVHQLRCPKCQNQDIADSHALVAKDLKNKVYSMVKAGQSKGQIVQYMKQRYGDFVYYQPPFNLSTVILWLLPVSLVVAGFVLIVVQARRSRATIVDQQQIADADKLLGEHRD